MNTEHSLKSIFERLGHAKKAALLVFLIDACFFLLVWLWGLIVQAIATKLGFPLLTTTTATILTIVQLIVLVLLIAWAKQYHLALAKKIFGYDSWKVSYARVLEYTLIIVIGFSLIYMAWGYAFAAGQASATVQAVLLGIFLLIIAALFQYLYPVQWHIAHNDSLGSAFKRSFAMFSAIKRYAVIGTVVLIEAILFLVYAVTFMAMFSKQGAPVASADVFMQQYGAFIGIWSAIFLVATYVLIYIGRFWLYAHATHAGGSTTPHVSAKPAVRKPKKKK